MVFLAFQGPPVEKTARLFYLIFRMLCGVQKIIEKYFVKCLEVYKRLTYLYSIK